MILAYVRNPKEPDRYAFQQKNKYGYAFS